MEVGRIIVGCITGTIALAFGIYAFFTSKCKGPIISNTYIWLSKEEREKVDKKAEYKLLTIIFVCLSLMFLFLAIGYFTYWKWTNIVVLIIAIFVITYAIVISVKNSIK